MDVGPGAFHHGIPVSANDNLPLTNDTQLPELAGAAPISFDLAGGM